MILALAGIAFLGSFIYGITGFGAALLTIPLASQFYDLRFVLCVFAVTDLVNALRVSLWQRGGFVREEVARLVPMCIVGTALGAFLVMVLPVRYLMIALGVFVLGFAIYSFAVRRSHPVIAGRWAYLAGTAGGITSAMFGAGGPPYAIYLSMRPHTKEQLRATLAATSLVSIASRIVAFSIAGLMSSATIWLTALALAPGSLAALWLANKVHARLSREGVMAALRLLLVVAGVSLVIRAANMA